MPRAHPDLTESKLVMLHALYRVGVMTDQQALRFMSENNLMDYIDVRLSLSELCEAALVVYDKGEERLYAIAPAGLEALNIFEGRVPAGAAELIGAVCERWALIFKRERELPCSFKSQPDGTCIVHAGIMEPSGPLLDICLHVGDRSEALAVCDAWHENAADIYKTLLDKLVRPGINGRKEIP